MSAQLAPAPVFQGLGFGGIPLPFGKLFTYIAGTSTPQATYTDSTQLQQNTNPVILNANGQANVWLVFGQTYKLVLQDIFGNQVWSVDQIPGGYPFTQQQIGQLLYPTSPAEISASITPINFNYPYMYVDRYATNTNPGTTDMSAAFNAAISVARIAGGTIRWGQTAPYATTAPINATNPITARGFGMTFHCDCGPEPGNVTPGPSLIFNHTGHGFDLTGTVGAVFENVAVTNGTNTPQTAFFQARLQSSLGPGHVGPSCGITRFTNCSSLGGFSKAVYYNYGAEDDQLVGCNFNNSSTAAGAKCISYTGNNIAGLTSTFQTIASGIAQSCIDHKIFGGELYMQSSDAAADCISIEQSDSVKIYGTWMLCASLSASGRSLVYVDMTNGTSNFGVLNGITAENAAFKQTYCLNFSNNAATPSGWAFTDSVVSSVTAAINAGSSAILDSFSIANLNSTSSVTITIPGTLQNSVLDLSPIVSLTVGTSIRNRLTGDTSRFTITTRTNDYWIDTGTTNKTINPLNTSAGITSSSGALIARARLSLTGPCLIFNVVLASATGNLAITANSTITLTAPGGQSFALADIGTCVVVDQTAGTINGAAVSTSSTTAVITIPVAVTATAHAIVISGVVFLA